MPRRRSSSAIATSREADRELELMRDGWITTRVTKKSRWSGGKDFFGIGDIIALKPDRIRIENVSSYRAFGKVQEMIDWLRKHEGKIPESLECAVSVWKPATKRLPERFIVKVIKQDEVGR